MATALFVAGTWPLAVGRSTQHSRCVEDPVPGLTGSVSQRHRQVRLAESDEARATVPTLVSDRGFTTGITRFLGTRLRYSVDLPEAKAINF
jgi:hypothetical protein